jgi:HEPN domain-containing protein
MHKPTQNVEATNGGAISLRCPHCRHEGSFSPHPKIHDFGWAEMRLEGNIRRLVGGSWAGARLCPNPNCGGLVMAIKTPDTKEIFPPEVIDFDATALPPEILSSLEEAVVCYAAGAHKATALMVRRVLEELCADRNAAGKDLKIRLQNLGSSVVVPSELLDAADELRLLGNDAAHIEAKSYDDIGKEEAGLAIELAKELLKAVYQYQGLVDKLRALKKS